MINLTAEIKPLITERSFDKANQGWYTFLVDKKFNKNQAAKIIEEFFGVQVEQITSAVRKGKVKKNLRTRTRVKKSDYKKIMVKLAKNQKIDLFEAGGK
jgi:large subunit ribosomal protein L23